MGVRYRKTKSVAPGVKVNLNKKSASVRFGGRGAGVTLNTNGKKTQSIGIPDTGLSYTKSSGGGKSDDSGSFGCLIPVIVVILVLSIGIAVFFADCKKQSPDFTGMDVFSIPNHPVYGCSVDDAKEFYKDYIDDDIVYFDGNYQNYQDGITLLTLDNTSGSKQYINDIELYFKNTETGSVNLDTALKITKEYLPLTLMQKLYVFERSYLITDFDYDSSNALANRYMRIICYSRSESTQTETSDHYLPQQIFVVLYSKDNESKIDYVVIKDSLRQNYIQPDFSKDKLLDTKWDYDFLTPDGVPITATEPSTTETTTELATKIESVTKKQVPASTKSETQKPTEKKKPPAQQNTPKTGKYHYPNCGTLKNANAENLTEINFDQTGNYSPCKKCNPPQA